MSYLMVLISQPLQGEKFHASKQSVWCCIILLSDLARSSIPSLQQTTCTCIFSRIWVLDTQMVEFFIPEVQQHAGDDFEAIDVRQMDVGGSRDRRKI